MSFDVRAGRVRSAFERQPANADERRTTNDERSGGERQTTYRL
jgi:hypothetical protein